MKKMSNSDYYVLDDEKKAFMLELQSEERPSRWLGWWYRLTTPVPPSANASYLQRELGRKRQLASTIMLVLALFMFVIFWFGIFGSNHNITPAAIGMLFFIGIAAACNRFGRLYIAGLILLFACEVAILSAALNTPSGLVPSALSLFDILAVTELLAVSLLPINSIWVVTVCNSVLSSMILLYWPHQSVAFMQMMSVDRIAVVGRPIFVHVTFSIILWLWVASASRALRRADHAQIIAQLEHALSETNMHRAKEAENIRIAVQDIADALTNFASGNIQVRVVLKNDSPLWAIGIQLNNFLNRAVRWLHMETELVAAQREILRLRNFEYKYLKLLNEIKKNT